MIVPQSLLDAVVVDSTSPSGLGGPVMAVLVAGRAGRLAGKTQVLGCKWEGNQHYVHRVIMVKMNGQNPLFVDHLDRKRPQQQPDNLRWCDHSINMKNRVFKPKANGLPQGIHQNTTGGYRFYKIGSWSKTYKTLQEAINEHSNYQHTP